MNEVFDVLGDVYNKYWRQITLFQYPNIEELALSKLPGNARILDVCCGTGTIAAKLCEQGFTVEGIDISSKVIEYARINAPEATFTVGDARSFHYESPFDAAITTLDSFNVMTDPKDLKNIFIHVYQALKPGGIFYFDMRNEEGYLRYWNGSQLSFIEAEGVAAFHSVYDEGSRLGLMKAAYFTRNAEQAWDRKDLYIPHKCYQEEEVAALLEEAGFVHVQTVRRSEGVYSEVSGRSHYTSMKAG
ncbi:class I SAM-dependent DNA methyltransferase [Paenibacillus thiaminolyticus]|uniref:class I SAM-dependent DNA methyltransferase n=1 Tax=Paenibacillus thiaminolyticus TaxID=49283 RepID=UPI002543D715|nr:class I SAM-dependent methyltransferase [Paenibacillus thiaminolyticus]WII34979.1 class I SAM-dependent methyltransferase [Paenibacillus thiaminolyticus]